MSAQAQASMTDLEYVQNMPAAHLLLQRQVNKQLWHVWNLADHKRVHEELSYNFEKTIISPGVELARGPYSADGMPPSLSLCYSICSRRWEQEEQNHIGARIGEIFFAKNGTGHWQHQECVTYALERVDEPRRWNKYCVYHLSSESFVDVILQHTQ